MHRVDSFDFGESSHGRRKGMLVFVDTEEGSFCECCRRMVRVRMVTMFDGEYGGPEVCETCIAAKLARLFVEPPPATAAPPPCIAAGVAAMSICDGGG